jgi:hypothetical protein
MRMRVSVILWLALVTVAAPLRADLVDHLGSPHNIKLIASPEVVLAWRTAASFKTNDYFGEDLWKKAGLPTLVKTNLAQQLSRILLEDRTYFEGDRGLQPTISSPVVMLNFARGTNSVDLFLSFKDNTLAVKVGTERYGLPLLLESDIETRRKEILQIIKKIFAEDPFIQKIPE